MGELNFDSLVEDPRKLKTLSRRVFLGVVGGAAASAPFAPLLDTSASQAAVAAPGLSAFAKAPAPDDERAWEAVASQCLLRDGLMYMNTGTRGPSPRYVHERQVEALHLTPAAIEARDRYLAKKLRDGLRAIDGTDVYVSDDLRMSCALVSFTVNGVATKDLNDILWERHNIYIRNVTHEEVDWDVNRASMHIMMTAAQVDELLGAIEEIAKA